MDHIRAVLLLSLGLVLVLLWQAWQRDYGRPPSPQTTPPEVQQPTTSDTATETPAPEVTTALPEAPPVAAATSATPAIQVQTDTVRAQIDTRGGELSRLQLLDFPVAADKPNEPLVFLDNTASLTFVMQGGLLGGAAAPSHQDVYEAAQAEYRLAEGDDELRVPLVWRSPEGVEVTKTFIFHRGSHLIDVTYNVNNTGAEPWAGRVYGQMLRRIEEEGWKMVPTYTGAAISSPEKRHEKVAFDDMADQPIDRSITNGWAAMLQHYFVAAIIPNPAVPFHYYTKVLGADRYIIGMYGPPQTVAPGARGEFAMRYYAGPKDQDRLETIAPGLDLTVDYGVLWFLAKPLFWWMQKLHGWTGNWGWAIILLTLTVKAALYHLAATSYRSMAHMKRVQPRMMALRERYANDRQRLNQAMMELYKEEKVNPLGGCLPIVVQIPVFLALYWVLLESVELRQAPFMGWIKDLSAYDPYFVLPVLMGITMYLQQKMNPAPPDPVQARVMQMLPFIFTVFFVFFPAGLVLYWLVNNVLSIGQQWLITRRIEGAKA